jgi:hypothetical protein
MRLLKRLIVSACALSCVLLRPGADSGVASPGLRATPAPMDVLYYSPVDVNYSWGPKGADLARLTADTPASANFAVTYDTSTGAWPPAAQSAFQAAVNVWANTLTTSTTTRIRARFRSDLGTNVLGSAGPSLICSSSSAGFVASTWYAAALFNAIKGISGGVAGSCGGISNSFEINANFSSTFDWDYGTSGVGVPGKVNFMTVVLHEVGHGLGFFGDFSSSGGAGSNPTDPFCPFAPTCFPEIYDRFTTVGNGGPLLLNTPSGTTLHSLLIGNNLYWNGTNGSGAKIEAHNFATTSGFTGYGDDNGFLRGSSYSHLDDVQYTLTPDGLMTWVLGNNEVYTAPGPVMRGIFKDIGWTVNAPVGPHTVGDYTGDGLADVAVFRASSTQFFVNGLAPATIGFPGDVPVVGDFNGNGVSDIAVYRPSDGTWYINGLASIQFGGEPADVPVPADYNGDGITDAAVFRTGDGVGAKWYLRGQPTVNFGLRGDIAMPADFDGDGKDDVAIYRPSNGLWVVRNSSNLAEVTTQHGLPGDIPVVGKFDGDALADKAVFRPSTGVWYLRLSTGSQPNYQLGLAGDVPLARDMNGDGVAELVVFRPSNATWYSLNRITLAQSSLQYGFVGDIPAHQRPRLPNTPTSDFDADGISDITVYRPSDGTWYTKTSTSNFVTTTSTQFGLNGDIRVPGDYDGDRRTDFAVYRPSNGFWYIRRSSNGVLIQKQFGLSTDKPVPGDYDGDSITDIAVYRPSNSTWYVLKSTSGFVAFTITPWGLPGDLPVVGDFDGDGLADLTVFRPSNAVWYARKSTTWATLQVQWGLSTDVPLPADFDGDGRSELNVYRPSSGTWFAVDPLVGMAVYPYNVQFGLPTDTPVAHDFDGDGRHDFGVFRPSLGQWYVVKSTTGGVLFVTWGLPADGPVVLKSGRQH